MKGRSPQRQPRLLLKCSILWRLSSCNSTRLKDSPRSRRDIITCPCLLRADLLLTAVILLCSPSAKAQLAGKGEIKGVVTDATGAVVPGATVTATATTQGTNFTRTTSNSGDFDLTPLNPDIYQVTVSAKGFQTLTQEDVHVNALEVADLKVSMTIGAETQSIDVSAAPPALRRATQRSAPRWSRRCTLLFQSRWAPLVAPTSAVRPTSPS